MVASRLVAVGHDDDLRAAQILRVFRTPFPRSAGIACRNASRMLDRVNILLTIDDVNETAIANRLNDERQAIEDATNAVELPKPTPIAGRTPLPKLLAGKADDLGHEPPVLVGIG